MRTTLALIALLVGSSPTMAEAQRGGWADVLTPGRQDAARTMRDGLALLVVALGPRQSDRLDRPTYEQLEQALIRFRRVRPFFETDPDLAYYTAIAWTNWRRPAREGGEELRVDEALVAWRRLREIDPDYMPARVAVEMAALHTRSGDFERSTAEYEAALRLSRPASAWLMRHPDDPNPGRSYRAMYWEWVLAGLYTVPDDATVHGNLAENHMLLGHLDRARAHYRAAIEASPYGLSRSLGRWGLALAHDRAGDHDAALEAARRAIESNPVAADPRYLALQRRYGSLAVLHHPNVFFEPQYEIHAYHAIGYEAYASMPHHDGSRRRLLELAAQCRRRYLVEGGTSSRFAATARASLERLEAETAELPEDPPSRESSLGLSGETRRAPDDTPPWRQPVQLWAPRDGPWLPLTLP